LLDSSPTSSRLQGSVLFVSFSSDAGTLAPDESATEENTFSEGVTVDLAGDKTEQLDDSVSFSIKRKTHSKVPKPQCRVQLLSVYWSSPQRTHLPSY